MELYVAPRLTSVELTNEYSPKALYYGIVYPNEPHYLVFVARAWGVTSICWIEDLEVLSSYVAVMDQLSSVQPTLNLFPNLVRLIVSCGTLEGV